MLREIAQYTAALLGRSAYQAPGKSNTGELDLDDPQVVRLREQHGGQIQRPAIPQTRWYLAQLEAAEHEADTGKLELAARLMRAAKMDGVFSGVLSTRTGGLVRLPKRFRGDADVIAALEIGHAADEGEVRSVFDEMFPATELALLAADGITLGCGVAQLVEVEGRDYPVMVRLEPQFLFYDWNYNSWSYNSLAGPLRIIPGDGRWILHTTGRTAPWANGIWRAIARAFIRKEHAANHKDNWESKLANPARVAVAPQGGTEAQADAWFQAVMRWGVNTVFGMRPGYDVKLIESNGRGWESFNKTIEDQNNEMIISVAGQLISTTGGSGFQNNDVHQTIRADLIKDTAEQLAYTINTQGIPAFVAARFGEAAIETKQCIVEWDVTPPKDRTADASSLTATASAITTLTDALKIHELTPDVAALCLRFAVPLEEDTVTDEALSTTPSTTSTTSAEGDEVTSTAPVDEDAAPAQDTALNGAQVSSLLQIVGQVAAGQLPRDSALEIMVAAFNMSHDQADKILGSVGAGFVPASTSVEVQSVEPEEEDVDPELQDEAA